MRIFLIERIIIRDSDPASQTYMKVKQAYKRHVCYYESEVIPSIGDVIAVSEFKDGVPSFYDVISVIHYPGNGKTANYSVEIEVVKHVYTHESSFNGYTVNENWPVISTLKEKSS